VLTEHSGPFAVHTGTLMKRHLVRQALAAADGVVAVSPTLREEMRPFLARPDEVEVIGEVVRDHFHGERRADAARPIVLTAAILTRGKGMDVLIDAVMRLRGRGVAVTLEIAGDGPERPALERQARERGVADGVVFLGALARGPLRDRMLACSVFASASRHESFGLVIAEAMACGVPVVATRCGGPEWVVTEPGGRLVERDDAEAMAAALAEVIAHPERHPPARVREGVVSRFGESAFLEAIARVYG
jgi:glycosyltransferase involved in cell wall biosynthesis